MLIGTKILESIARGWIVGDNPDKEIETDDTTGKPVRIITVTAWIGLKASKKVSYSISS